jgi:membrane fusion protein, multidrug efflux system
MAAVAETQNRRRLAVVALIVVAGVAAAGGGLHMLAAEDEAPEQAEVAMDVQVRAPLSLQRNMVVSLSGEVEARHTVSAGFRVGGLVARVGPEEGQHVRAGDVLAELDPEDYRLQLELAQSVVARINDQYERARQVHAEGSMAPAEFRQLEAGLREARAHEGLARRALQNARLVAPIGGVVARRGVEPGEQVAPGVPVFTIVALDPVQIRVGVPEAEIGRVRIGQPTAVTIPSLRGYTAEGTVRVVGVASDPASRTYTVRIQLSNPNGLLRPGMIAEVRIREDAEIAALTLPGEAIVRDIRGTTLVYVYSPADRRVHARPVTVGSVYGNEVEIAAGLSADELVVVGGQHRVREGGLVQAHVVPTPVGVARAADAPAAGATR